MLWTTITTTAGTMKESTKWLLDGRYTRAYALDAGLDVGPGSSSIVLGSDSSLVVSQTLYIMAWTGSSVT
jgi:hypothetical protein